jgi:hypothetical protein
MITLREYIERLLLSKTENLRYTSNELETERKQNIEKLFEKNSGYLWNKRYPKGSKISGDWYQTIHQSLKGKYFCPFDLEKF